MKCLATPCPLDTKGIREASCGGIYVIKWIDSGTEFRCSQQKPMCKLDCISQRIIIKITTLTVFKVKYYRFLDQQDSFWPSHLKLTMAFFLFLLIFSIVCFFTVCLLDTERFIPLLFAVISNSLFRPLFKHRPGKISLCFSLYPLIDDHMISLPHSFHRLQLYIYYYNYSLEFCFRQDCHFLVDIL